MQKLEKLPKLCNDRGRAYSRHKGNRYYFGKWGTAEAHKKYKRFCAKLILGEPIATPEKAGHNVGNDGANVKKTGGMLVVELTVEFLKHHTPRLHKTHIMHFKSAVGYLVELYGSMPVNDFSPKKLRAVRDLMVRRGRLCRKMVNSFTTRLVRIFTWGCEEEWVNPSVAGALKMVRHLPENEPGTFDHDEREPVPLDIIRRTLPFLIPTVATMVMLQYLTGMRPGEVCRMTVGSINRSRGNGLWYYDLEHHKTKKHMGKKVIPLGKVAQELLEPFLAGKKASDAVFSPKMAMQEKRDRQRAERKTPLSPSQKARDKKSADNPASRVGNFYDRNSYRKAIEYAITKGNKSLPDGQKIPKWFPYLLRNATATDLEEEHGLDAAQAQLGHKKADMTRRYSKAQLRIREKLAREQVNPFADAVPSDHTDLTDVGE